MKRYTLYIISFIFLALQLQGQNDVLQLSFTEALSYGIANRYDVKSNQINIDIADEKIKNSRLEWLPDVSATGNILYHTQLEGTLIPAGFLGLTEPTIVALGAKNMSTAGIDVNQPIFNTALSYNIKMAKNDLLLAREKNRASDINIKSQIAEAYLDALFKRFLIPFAEAETARYLEYYNLAEGKYKNGALIENDFLKAKLDYENAAIQDKITRQNYELALQQLKSRLNIPDEKTLVLTDSLQSIAFSSFILKDPMYISQNRTEIKQMIIQQQGNILEIEKIKKSMLPSLSSYANYSQQFLGDKFNYGNDKSWAPYSFLGLKLIIPISRFYKNDIQHYTLQSKQMEWSKKQEEQEIHAELQTATLNLHNASDNLSVTKNNYELSNNIYTTQKQQYTLGAFTYSNLLDTERSLYNAEQNYIKAMYDYLVAKLHYMIVTEEL